MEVVGPEQPSGPGQGSTRVSPHVVRRVGELGIYMAITSTCYEVADAVDDSRRYLALMNLLSGKVVGVTDYSAMRALQPGVRHAWAKVMADRGGDYKVVHALLPAGTIGKVVGMALTAWGLVVGGVRIHCYGDRAKWRSAAASDGAPVPHSEAA